MPVLDLYFPKSIYCWQESSVTPQWDPFHERLLTKSSLLYMPSKLSQLDCYSTFLSLLHWFRSLAYLHWMVSLFTYLWEINLNVYWIVLQWGVFFQGLFRAFLLLCFWGLMSTFERILSLLVFLRVNLDLFRILEVHKSFRNWTIPLHGAELVQLKKTLIQ